tara:strand:- start:679 stop:927 length:249 start_codon:yes stop_codon:yes gene_type:complete
MSEGNIVIDSLCDLILNKCNFTNEKELKNFIKELKINLLELYDEDYETETSESDEEYSDEEVEEEQILVKKDKEEFYEIIVN